MATLFQRWLFVFPALAMVSGCGQAPTPNASLQVAETMGRADRLAFMANLRVLCGQSFAGRLVSTDEADADFRSLPMVMHVRDCETDVIRIPFHVGDDHSRTWVITDLGDQLLLEHDHRHEDGSPDAVTLYGGVTDNSPDTNSGVAQNFPVDEKTRALFIREGIEASVQNIWRIEIQSDDQFAYQMSRPGRLFRVEFDLTQTVDTPPPAWGYMLRPNGSG